MLQTLEFVLAQLPYLAVAVVMLLMGKVFFQMANPGLKDSIIYKNNPASGIVFGGYMLGIAIALSGIFFGIQGQKTDTPKDTMMSLLDFIILGGMSNLIILATGLLMSLTLFNKKFPNTEKSVRKHKLIQFILDKEAKAPAWVIASHFIAGGIMVKSIMTGESDNFLIGLRDIWAYWAVGMAALFIASTLFKHIVTPYDDVAEIHDNNESAGVMVGGFNVAFAWVVGSTLVGASSNFFAEVGTTIALCVILIPFMLIAGLVVAKLVLTPSNIQSEIARDKNFGSAALLASLLCGIAVLSSSVIEPVMLKASATAAALAQAEQDEAIHAAIVETEASIEKQLNALKAHEAQVAEPAKDSDPKTETPSETSSPKVNDDASSKNKE